MAPGDHAAHQDLHSAQGSRRLRPIEQTGSTGVQPAADIMKHALLPCLLLAGLLLPSGARADVPPPEQLLPSDTLAVLTIPDAARFRAAMSDTPALQFWNAPEMKPFRDKFMARFNQDVLASMEKAMSVKLSNYTAVARGQVTMAFVPGAGADSEPKGLLLIDTRDKAGEASKLVAGLKQQWADAGNPLRKQMVRDVEFTTITVEDRAFSKALEKLFPRPPGSATPGRANGTTDICIGQSGSLLMIGESPSAFEKVLVRLSGGGVTPLAEQAAFTAAYGAGLREATAYGWFNARAVFGHMLKEMESGQGEQGGPPGGPAPAMIMNALGLTGIQSMTLYARHESDGMTAGLHVGTPESSRKGLLKIFAPEAKDAGPPSAIPGDAARFFRWRLDGQKAMAGIEALVTELFPPAQGILGMILDNAGKDQDPNFDLRKSLIGNLGDDMITYAKPPRSARPQDLDSPPGVMLVGSPRAEQLVAAARTGLGSLLPPAGDGSPKEREFLGRKIYSIPMPALPGTITAEPRSLNYTASGSYVVMSPDAPMLEEYLRGPEAQKGRPLRETPGLNEAAQKVGGMGTGMFGYENQMETVRLTYEALRKDPEAFDRMMQGPLGMSPISTEMRRNRQDWLDFSLLPEWGAVSKYFHYSVYAGSTTPEGLHFKAFSPTPPSLRK